MGTLERISRLPRVLPGILLVRTRKIPIHSIERAKKGFGASEDQSM